MGSRESALRARFAEIETDELARMWCAEERQPWADALLRAELLARGVEADDLDAGARRRSSVIAENAAATDAHSRIDTLVAPLVALFVAGGLAGVVRPVAGDRGALATMAIVLGGYVVLRARWLGIESRAANGVEAVPGLVKGGLHTLVFALVALTCAGAALWP